MNPTFVGSYRDLGAWRQAMALASACFKATRKFPRSEVYGMTSQMRRAATSVPANIAEGHGRETTGNYIQFLRVAQGSLKELETLILLAADDELLDKAASEELLAQCENVGKPLRGLIRALQSKEAAEGKGAERTMSNPNSQLPTPNSHIVGGNTVQGEQN